MSEDRQHGRGVRPLATREPRRDRSRVGPGSLAVGDAGVARRWTNGFAASPVVDGRMLVVGGLDGTLYGFPID